MIILFLHFFFIIHKYQNLEENQKNTKMKLLLYTLTLFLVASCLKAEQQDEKSLVVSSNDLNIEDEEHLKNELELIDRKIEEAKDKFKKATDAEVKKDAYTSIKSLIEQKKIYNEYVNVLETKHWLMNRLVFRLEDANDGALEFLNQEYGKKYIARAVFYTEAVEKLKSMDLKKYHALVKKYRQNYTNEDLFMVFIDEHGKLISIPELKKPIDFLEESVQVWHQNYHSRNWRDWELLNDKFWFISVRDFIDHLIDGDWSRNKALGTFKYFK